MKHRPLAGTSFIPTPPYLANKHCLINVWNRDNKCFVWSVLASLYPVFANQNRVSNYRPHVDKLCLDGLEFPLKLRDVPRFETLNPTIAMNCFYYEVETREIIICYHSPHHDRSKHVNLLLLDEINEQGSKLHYTCIRDMSKLACGRVRTIIRHLCAQAV